jgi:hypothetical protein
VLLARDASEGLARPLAILAALLADEERGRIQPSRSADPPARRSAWVDAALQEGLRDSEELAG